MDLATIVCEYIYGAFAIAKAAIESLIGIFETAIEKIYSIAMTLNNLIFTTLGKALDAILLIITKALNSLIKAMNNSIGGWPFCAPAFGCNFFIEQILDPDSLIAKTIRKIFEGKDDCFCTKNERKESIRDIQQTLYNIATDYENFKSQICNGLSLDMATDMATDLCLGYLGELNSWKHKIDSKISSLKKKLQNLLNSIKESALFKLLEEIQAFFECVLDSELCANVDTAKSFYQYVLSKLSLVESGPGEYLLSPNMENEILSTAVSFTKKINEAVKRLEGIIGNLSCSVSMKGASNALDLSSTIIGIGSILSDAFNKKRINWNRIPIIDYSKKTIKEITSAYEKLHTKSTSNPDDALAQNKCVTLNDVLLETIADGEPVDYLEVDGSADTSHVQELIQVGDKFVTVADAARQLYTGDGDPVIINYCRTMGGYLNVDEVLTRY